MQRSRTQRRPVRTSAIVVALGLLTAGCSGDRLLGGSSAPPAPGAAPSSPSLGDRFSNLFGRPQTPQQQPQGSPTNPAGPLPDDFECPSVAIRAGTSTYAVSAPGAETSVLAMRYQATIGQTARECRRAPGNMLAMKVGMEGRIILGPAGGPGQMEIPLRYAVVREGPEPKTILTKLRWVTVAIPPGTTNVPFTQIDDEIVFPMPHEYDLEAYVVYIGFDREAVKVPERKRPTKPAPRPARRQG